ncbi:MAG: hypothetical protein M0Z73_02575 [Betaproteobacteria bacterium]|nr:hypothetical protein [Betaproteobacteria bacterium]
MNELFKNHAASSKALAKHMIDGLTVEGAEELTRRLADGWALALTTTLTTPPTIFCTISKPGHPLEEVFRVTVAQ